MGIKASEERHNNPRYANRPDYCGIEGIKLLVLNDTDDPKLHYKGYNYNVYDVEDYFQSDWEEDVENGDYKGSFAEYLADHADDIRHLLDNEITPIDKANRKAPTIERD